jgi:hypothetical protein
VTTCPAAGPRSPKSHISSPPTPAAGAPGSAVRAPWVVSVLCCAPPTATYSISSKRSGEPRRHRRRNRHDDRDSSLNFDTACTSRTQRRTRSVWTCFTARWPTRTAPGQALKVLPRGRLHDSRSRDHPSGSERSTRQGTRLQEARDARRARQRGPRRHEQWERAEDAPFPDRARSNPERPGTHGCHPDITIRLTLSALAPAPQPVNDAPPLEDPPAA